MNRSSWYIRIFPPADQAAQKPPPRWDGCFVAEGPSVSRWYFQSLPSSLVDLEELDLLSSAPEPVETLFFML